MRKIKAYICLLLALIIAFSAGSIAFAEPLSSSGFEVHFINVGQGDSALILCDGHAMLIDGGEKENSDLLYSYLKKHGVQELDYIVCSHPHKDHIGGLAGALNYAKVQMAFCPVKKYDSKGFENFKKYLKKQGVSITVPEAGDVFPLGSAVCTVLGPVKAAKGNNNSLVIRIEYGDTSFLFSGDAEYEEEHDILATGCELKSTVLKVGHHGSEDATSYQYLYEVDPQYAVISVGDDNSYNHPNENTLSRLRDAGVTVYRTDLNGTVICRSDGKAVTFSPEKGNNLNALQAAGENSISRGMLPEAEESSGCDYILNTNTHKFHYPECGSAKKMKEENKEYYNGSRADIIARGYSPCGNCKP